MCNQRSRNPLGIWFFRDGAEPKPGTILRVRKVNGKHALLAVSPNPGAPEPIKWQTVWDGPWQSSWSAAILEGSQCFSCPLCWARLAQPCQNY